MVSRSRSSLTVMTSTSWRSALFIARANSWVSKPTWRWRMMLLPWWKTNSTGSSIVTMLQERSRAIIWVMLQSVVVLPELDTPVIRIRPSRSPHRLCTVGPWPSWVRSGIWSGMKRKLPSIRPMQKQALPRKRPMWSTSMEKSSSSSCSSRARWVSLSAPSTSSRTSSALSTSWVTGVILPCRRMVGAAPGERWRSEAPAWMAMARYSMRS